MKICTKCKVPKNPEDDFYRRKNGRSHSECKVCTRTANNARPYNKEKEKEYRLRYELKTGKIRSKIRYKKDKEEIRKRTEAYRLSLIGKIKAYQKSARKRNISFNLSQEQCEGFYKQPCNYCGDTLETLGIDRIDNTIGYEIENCTPCCTKCNMMKHILSKEVFLDHINKIFKHSI